jgi:hypothetical protein
LLGSGVGKKHAVGDVIAIEEDGVGVKAIDLVHHVAEEIGLGVLGIMEVGNLNELEAVKWIRKVIEADAVALEADFVTGDFGGVEWKSDAGGSGGF